MPTEVGRELLSPPDDEQWVHGRAPARQSIDVVFDMATAGEGSSRLHPLTISRGGASPENTLSSFPVAWNLVIFMTCLNRLVTSFQSLIMRILSAGDSRVRLLAKCSHHAPA